MPSRMIRDLFLHGLILLHCLCGCRSLPAFIPAPRTGQNLRPRNLAMQESREVRSLAAPGKGLHTVHGEKTIAGTKSDTRR